MALRGNRESSNEVGAAYDKEYDTRKWLSTF
jgi:hypothetical protein